MLAGGSDGSDFVHLHVHTEYSMLDGAAHLPALFARAADLGQKALATTDHGYLFGAYDFWTQGQAAGVKPIIGLEAYLTPGTARQDRTRVKWGDGGSSEDVSAQGAYTHLTLLSETTHGMHNLFRLSSLASLEGYFYKPRMDRDLLSQYGRGLIATTGCPSGEVQRRLLLDQYPEALKAAGDFQDIFGKENYYVEVMDHGLPIDRQVLPGLIKIARAIGAKVVATNDSHYTAPEDAGTHEALLCVQSTKTLDDPSRMKFDGSGYYLKSAAEMRELWRDYPEACDSTLEIAERCNVEFTPDQGRYMPKFAVPRGESEHSWFVREVELGLVRRFPDGIPDAVRKQVEYETDVITSKGYAGYYLVVADFINWAKSQGIRVGPGRGSGAGSMAAYAMGITELDPLKNGLFFERFLNPERPSLPDFDVDFDERRRGEVIRYVTEKYGSDRVAQIVTFGTIKAKQAVKDAARVLGYSFAVGERLTKAMPPPAQGKELGLAGMFDPEDPRYAEASEFRALVAEDAESERVLATARGLENLKRQWGVHAAGVIMSSERLLDVIPVMRRDQDGAIITQFDYPTCEALGLVKMDFLGLRNLTVLEDALAGMEMNGKERLVLEDLPLDDAATYELLASGDTLGVFQLDGSGMRSLLRQLKPDNFEDISAVQALYRPGPMGADSHTNYALRKNGLQPVEPLHPELAEPLRDILEGTYGLIVYQEQVMLIAQRVAGYTLGGADLLRRVMGKKKPEELQREYEPFSRGMRERGFSEAAIDALWETLVPFAAYAFNKAHSAAYGLVSYWTAYLKTHYPTEYMAALLTSVRGDKDKSAVYLAECRRMGITVLPPDVNSSSAYFTPVGRDIRFGLAAVRNVGIGVVDAIEEARTEKGAYTSFQDFLNKVGVQACNKRVIESLIKAGAFDAFDLTRRAMHEKHEEAVDSVMGVKRKEAIGQFDLFGELNQAHEVAVPIPELPEWPRDTVLSFEREMLGLYVSGHPLNGLETALTRIAEDTAAGLADAEAYPDGKQITLAGLMTGLERRVTKLGKLWAQAALEDLEGSVELKFFPKVYARLAPLLAEDLVVWVKGRVKRDDDEVMLSVSDLRPLDLEPTGEASPLVIKVAERRANEAVLSSLKHVLSIHPGQSEVWLRLEKQGGATVMRLDHNYQVEESEALKGDLFALLGPGCV